MRTAFSNLRIDRSTQIAYFAFMDIVLKIWPTMADLATDLDMPYSTVAAWKARGRIPAHRDFALIEAAAARGFTLTLEELARARHSQNTSADAA